MDEQVDIPQSDQQAQTPPEQMPDKPVLPPEKRKELHGIVSKMILNKEPEDNIKLVIDHYTKKNLQQVSTPQSNISPAQPKPFDALGFTGVPTMDQAADMAFQRHKKVVDEASKTIDNTIGTDNKLKPLAAGMLADKKSRQNKMLSDQQNFGEGSQVTGTQTFQPLDFSAPKDEEVSGLTEAIKNDPSLAEDALIQAKKVNPDKAKDIDKALYVLHSSSRAVSPEKQNQIANNAHKISNGELEYNPRNKQLVKPEGFADSFNSAYKKRDEDMALFDLADNGSKEDVIKKLNADFQNDNNPDNPTPVPKGIAANLTSFAGGQGKITAEVTAANIIGSLAPGSGEVMSAALYAHEFGRRGFANELRKSYAAFKQQGLSDSDAYDKAESQAKKAMIVDATTAAVMGKTTGGSATKTLAKTAENAGKLATEGGWYQGVIKNAYKHIGEETPAALKNASLAGGGELTKNISANIGGEKRDVTEGVAGAAANMAALHYTISSAMAVMGKLGKAAAQPIYKRLVQGASKLPIEDVKEIAKQQVDDGLVTPLEAVKNVQAIETNKEIDQQIPSKVTNDEVRLDLHKWIEKKDAATEEKKTVNSAFAEPLKLKIEGYDQKINELANSPEAKQESPAPEQPEKTAADLFITAAKNGDVKGTYAEMVNSDPKQANAVIKDIAEQSQGIDSDGKPLPGGSRYEDMVKDYPKEIIDAAIKEYPKKKPVVTVSTPNIVNVKLKSDAIQEPRTGEILQREQSETGSAGSERGGMEQSQQGDETPQQTISNEEAQQPQGISDKEKLDPYGLPFENEASDNTTGIKNSKSNMARFERGLPTVEVPKMGKDAEVVAEGKRLVDEGVVNPRNVVNKILDTKQGMQPDEAKAMQYYMHQLGQHETNLRDELHAAETPEAKASVSSRLQQLSDEVDAATQANIISGTAWSNVGNIRQIVTDQGFNPSREKAFIKDAYGGEIPAHIKVKLDAITKERDEALAAKAKIEEQLRQKMANNGFEAVKKQAKRTAKNAETKEALKKEESDLLQQLKKAFKKDIGQANAGIPIPKETLEVLGKLAVNYVKQGINGLEALVDKLHGAVGEDSGLSKKEIRDAIAEYEPLQEVRETNRLNKKAELLNEKTTLPFKKAGEFNEPSKVKKEFRKSTEWVKAQQRVANAEFKIKVEKRKAFESQKNMYQKSLAWLGRLTRLSILSGYNVLGKLASAATIGSAAKRPVEQIIGSVYQGIFKGIAEKAPIEGGINVKAEAKFYKEFFNPKKFVHNAWQILKTGSSDLGKRLGSAEYEHVPGLYLPTDMHQIIKDPPKRATFEASRENAMNWAEKNGLDINDELVNNSIDNAAYKRAQYEIFQEQNWLSKKFTSYKSSLEKQGNIGATGKFVADFLIPVSTVPTNIVRRVVTTSPLGLIRGSAEVVNAYRKGIESLTPEQADHVMMQLKQGTLGTALWLIGWYGAGQFGGLYSKFNPDKKRAEGVMKHDEMSVGGKMVPKPVQHALPLEIIQFAATARHVFDNYVDNKKASTPEAIYNAGLSSIGALLEQIPVVETGVHAVEATSDPYQASKFKEDMQRRVEPTILRETGIIPKEQPKQKSTGRKSSRERQPKGN